MTTVIHDGLCPKCGANEGWSGPSFKSHTKALEFRIFWDGDVAVIEPESDWLSFICCQCGYEMLKRPLDYVEPSPCQAVISPEDVTDDLRPPHRPPWWQRLLANLGLFMLAACALPLPTTPTPAASAEAIVSDRAPDPLAHLMPLPPEPEPPPPALPPVPPPLPAPPANCDPKAYFDGWFDMSGTPVSAQFTVQNAGMWKIRLIGDGQIVQEVSVLIGCGDTLTRAVWADTWKGNPLEVWHAEALRDNVLIGRSADVQNPYN